MAWNTPNTENSALPAPTPAPRRYRCKLDTATDVRREMQRVYRESRSQTISVDHASKWANMLSLIVRAIETSEFERRLEALEGNG